MERLIFISAVCVAFSLRQVEEANQASLVEHASTAKLVFMDDMDDMDEHKASGDTSSWMMEMEESTNETATCGTAKKPNYEITQEIGKGSW